MDAVLCVNRDNCLKIMLECPSMGFSSMMNLMTVMDDSGENDDDEDNFGDDHDDDDGRRC